MGGGKHWKAGVEDKVPTEKSNNPKSLFASEPKLTITSPSSLNVVFTKSPHTSPGDKNFSTKHEFTMEREIWGWDI